LDEALVSASVVCGRFKHPANAFAGLPQLSIVVAWPGEVIAMTPPTVHESVSELSRPGFPPINTTDVDPGDQGPEGAGTHGVGVPDAAAVRILQFPNGGIFATGAKSCMVAASCPPILTVLWLVTQSEPGLAPLGHMSAAPFTTAIAIGVLRYAIAARFKRKKLMILESGTVSRQRSVIRFTAWGREWTPEASPLFSRAPEDTGGDPENGLRNRAAKLDVEGRDLPIPWVKRPNANLKSYVRTPF